MALLEVSEARVWFGGIKAVDGVSLSLESGGMYGLVGPNGSGKTTLLNALSRTQSLTSGTIHFQDRDITSAPTHTVSRGGLARTFQLIRLIPSMTVRENVMLGADRSAIFAEHGSRRARRQAIADEADDAIERLGLAPIANLRPTRLPYGTQRRVEIARALAGRPVLLLFDEPVAGMNRSEREEIGEVIRSLHSRGLTQLLIEHDLRMIQELCEHLFVMNFGRWIAEGEPHATAHQQAVREAYLGRSKGATA